MVQYSFVMQLVQMRFDSQCGTQGATLNYHGNKAFQANTWLWNAWWRWYSPQ